MKNLPLKHKIFIAAAAILLLVWSFFASGTGKTAAKPEKAAETPAFTEVQTERETSAEETTAAEESTEETTAAETVGVTETSTAADTTAVEAKAEPTTAAKTEPTTAKAEPAAAKAAPAPEKTENTCTVSVSCGTILANLDDFDRSKLDLLPADGVIIAPEKVSFTDGESVFDVLLRLTRQKGIHFEFTRVPAYDSVYVEGINNIYEFDCGELSGWEYRVNGVHPRFGCDMYKLEDGDTVEWVYTCDLGRDIGDDFYADKP